jgi:hypothetical protein
MYTNCPIKPIPIPIPIPSLYAGMSADTQVNEDEFRRLIALLQAFDILMDKPGEEVGVWVYA